METGPTYAADVVAARRFDPLIEGGWVSSIIEEQRCGSRSALGRVRGVGVATAEQLEAAIAAERTGPLLPEAIQGVEETWASMAQLQLTARRTPGGSSPGVVIVKALVELRDSNP